MVGGHRFGRCGRGGNTGRRARSANAAERYCVMLVVALTAEVLWLGLVVAAPLVRIGARLRGAQAR
jgi:hypothetical protein